ncbi:MAG: hypothetical protein PF590_06850 [Candidatus Delongbacteria bacterium]|nr:hypothetical protein [Candidatus Delongbacteria bacterium]
MVTSCEEEVDVNADWKNIPVVYGLLNQNDSVHYIKLNKAFLGDASAINMAQESDSLFYDDAEVYINQIINGQISKRLNFVAVDTIPKPEGLFANDRNSIYVYEGKIQALNNSGNPYTYELHVNIPSANKHCTSAIELISGARIVDPSSIREIALNSYDIGSVNAKYETGENGRIYQMVFRFYYLEVTNEGDTIKDCPPIEIYWPVTIVVGAGSQIGLEFPVEKFYDILLDSIQENENLTRLVRYPKSVSFTLHAADENFQIYSSLSEPAAGVVQEKPFFTNINNGVGLFAARLTKQTFNKVSNPTISTLANDTITEHLNFADLNNPYYLSKK